MNKILFTIFLFPVLLFAQDTCQITGTVYLVDGKTPFANGRIFVTRADKSGSLFLNTSKTYRTNASGVVTFSAPRTTGTDTAYVTVRSDFGNLTTEEILAVPDAATANLATLAGVNRYSTSTVLVPYGQFYVGRGNDTARVMYTLALAGGIGMQIDAYGRPQLFLNSDSLATGSGVTVGVLSDSLDANPRGGGGGISASELSDSLDADPRYRIDITARNITAGKADADSVSQQITLVKNMLDTKGDSDSLAWVADTAKAGNLAANTARAVADAHALRTDNPHTVTAAQLGALTSESDPTAAAKAQTVVSDTIDVIVPRTGIVVTSRLADSLAARALAVGDSLLAMRGFVRSAIKDTLLKYSYGIMAGDTAALGKVLDAMYPRSGGGGIVSPVVKADSLIVGIIKIDTLHGYQADSTWVVVTEELPAFSLEGGIQGHMKIGYKTFYFVQSGVQEGWIVADTANNVKLYGVRWESYGVGEGDIYGMPNSGVFSIGHVDMVNTTTAAYSMQIYGHMMNTTNKRNNWKFYTTPNGNCSGGCNALFKMTVAYYVPAGSTTSWGVKIHNL